MLFPFENIDNALVIAPNSIKDYFFTNQKNISQTKFLNRRELIENIYPKVSLEAVVELHNHFHLSYQYAKAVCDNIQYIDDRHYGLPKLDELSSYFVYLKNRNLISFDELFIEYLKTKHLFIFESEIDESMITRLLQFGIKCEVVHYGNVSKIKSVLTFDDIYEEIHYISNEIAELIAKKVDINKIFILGADEAYFYCLKKYCSFFGFEVQHDNDLSLFNLNITTNFLNLLKTNDIETTYATIKEKYNDEIDIRNLQLIVKTLIPYEKLTMDNEFRQELYKNLLKSTPVIHQKYRDVVRLINDFNFAPDSHVFIVNFSNGVFPKSFNNNDFLSDKEKEILCLTTSDKLNEQERRTVVLSLSQNNVESISFKESSPSGQSYISFLVKELGLETRKPAFQKNQFGKVYLELLLSSYKDSKRKYLYAHPYFYSLDNRIYVPYMIYDHSFKHFNATSFDKPMHYSFSQFSTFFECSFKYYLDRILCIGDFEDNFPAKVGTLIHGVLQENAKSNFDFDTTFDNVENSLKFTTREKVLLRRVKENTRNVVSFVQKHENGNQYIDKIYTELDASYNLSSKSTIFGKIDKLVLTNNSGQKGYYIVDYKSTVKAFDERQLAFGSSLQLPLYILLSKNRDEVVNRHLIGIYFEQITSKVFAIPKKDDLAASYYKQFTLSGPTCDNRDLIATIDPNISSSDYISGLNLNKDGSFNKKFKVINEDKFSQLSVIALSLANKADLAIRNNQFDINPLRYSSSLTSCTYCPYRSICYRQESDLTYAKLDEERGEGDE